MAGADELNAAATAIRALIGLDASPVASVAFRESENPFVFSRTVAPLAGQKDFTLLFGHHPCLSQA
jgi:hypothetical protein